MQDLAIDVVHAVEADMARPSHLIDPEVPGVGEPRREAIRPPLGPDAQRGGVDVTAELPCAVVVDDRIEDAVQGVDE